MTPAPQTTIRAAVVGLGSVSFEHLDRIATIPGAEVAGVCDLSPTLARAVALRLGAGRPFTDFSRMLDETRPHVVHVLTPPQSHLALALEALQAGAHVLVEKPVTVGWEDYVTLREAAREHGRMLCENYNYRFTDVVLEAIGLVRAGRLGEVVAVEVRFGGVMGPSGPYADRDLPHFAHELPGGALRNFVSHPISLALAFMDEPGELRAWRRRVGPAAVGDDELRALLAAERACGVIAVTANASPPAFSLCVEGNDGSLEVDVYNRRLELRTARSAGIELVRSGVGRLGGSIRLLGRRASGRQNPYEGLGTLLRSFYAAARGQAPAPVAVAEMDAVNRVVDRIFDPARRL